MKISTKDHKWRNWARENVGPFMYATNVFGMSFKKYPDNFVEWDVAEDGQSAALNVHLTKCPGDYSFARAYPKIIKGSSDGGDHTYGMEEPHIYPVCGKKTRGDNDKWPMYDMKFSRANSGLPMPVTEMIAQSVMIEFACKIPGDMAANTLGDQYAHWMPGKNDINESISPNTSKLVNLQAQLGHGKVNQAANHAYGWSGAERLLKREIGGIDWDIGHKLETHMGNRFPFISFHAEGVSAFDSARLWQWVYENLEELLAVMQKKGCEACNLNRENLEQAWIPGIVMGNEMLGEVSGEIIWDKISVDVGNLEPDKPHDMPMRNADPTPQDSIPWSPPADVKQPDKPALKKSKSDKKAQKRKKDKSGALPASDPARCDTTPRVRVGECLQIPGTDDFDRESSATVMHHVTPNSAARIRTTWPLMEVEGLKPCQALLTYVTKDGERKVEFEVVA